MIKRIKAWREKRRLDREKRRLDRERADTVEALNEKYGGDWYFCRTDGLGIDVYYDAATDKVTRYYGGGIC